MTIQQIFLYPAQVILHFVLSLFEVYQIPYGWEVFISGLLGIWLWVRVFQIILGIIKRLFGFYGGA